MSVCIAWSKGDDGNYVCESCRASVKPEVASGYYNDTQPSCCPECGFDPFDQYRDEEFRKKPMTRVTAKLRGTVIRDGNTMLTEDAWAWLDENTKSEWEVIRASKVIRDNNGNLGIFLEVVMDFEDHNEAMLFKLANA